MSIMSALDNLSNLVHEAIQFKTTSSTNDEFVEMLKQKQSTLLLERDEAVAIKNALEVNLARAKVDLMAVNSQLLEAISQKLQQQKELEAWQDDMEQMIQKALNERNEQQKVNALRRIQATSPNQSKSWFFRRTRHNSEDSEKSSGSATSEPKTPQPSRFSSWLRRKPNPDVDMSSSTGDAVS
uniref:Uncharacterized protein n=1 Tax=Ciona savignyi TaxID=51511 RepID=H2Y5X4_CIOSA